MSDWQPIDTAKLGVKVMLWHPAWRSPFPGTPNGSDGAVYVDTPTPEHGGWQTHATHWQPIITPALSPMPSAADIDARFERLRHTPNLSQFAFDNRYGTDHGIGLPRPTSPDRIP